LGRRNRGWNMMMRRRKGKREREEEAYHDAADPAPARAMMITLPLHRKQARAQKFK
jgi:hypothetical protein